MFVSIINFLENNLEKEILSTLNSKKDIADVVLLVQEYVNKLGTDIIQEVLEEVDRGIKDSPYRKEKWQVVNAEAIQSCHGQRPCQLTATVSVANKRRFN